MMPTTQLLCAVLAVVVLLDAVAGEDKLPYNNGLARLPPMGWMSWERFRCQVDCAEVPNACIDENLYRNMTDQLVEGGYLAAGYTTISIDDCWMTKRRQRGGQIVADPVRFPSGMAALAEYMHSRGVQLGIYSDAGTQTCCGYAGSKGYEQVDALTFADWGVDYLKFDGCNNDEEGWRESYHAMGRALQRTGRNITYSCSWPAYLGDNETVKPYSEMKQAGCNLWRNWRDVDNVWESVSGIIDHWGDYSNVLSAVAGPGHWNDMDMIMAGNDHDPGLLTLDQAKIQLAIWSICASPLIMSNDLRTVPVEYRELLLNPEMIAVDQDPNGKAGQRVSREGDAEVWARPLSGNRLAVVLYNRGGDGVMLSISAKVEELSRYFLGISWNRIHVRDVWKREVLGTYTGAFRASVPPVACIFIVVSPLHGPDGNPRIAA